MEKAIKIAMDNGYYDYFGWHKKDETKKLCLLDPLFWQALGKGLGWDKTHYAVKSVYMRKDDDGYQSKVEKEEIMLTWKWYMHFLVDHLAEGKDIYSFFNELIK